jgi:hypothetical protein
MYHWKLDREALYPCVSLRMNPTRDLVLVMQLVAFVYTFFFEKKLYLYTSLKSWLKRSCFTLLVKLRADLIHALEIMQSRYSYDCKFVRVFPVCVSVLSIIVKSIVALAYCAALYLKG